MECARIGTRDDDERGEMPQLIRRAGCPGKVPPGRLERAAVAARLQRHAMSKTAAYRAPGDLGIIAPGLFVVLWSSAFVTAKLGLRDADPLTFLGVRFVLAAAFMALLATALSAPWPRSPRAIGHAAIV